ncbi:uncharacterized protein LOC110007811 isoform X1 [Amborella trichopoda]|uniref:uncharacterized protein LOC110007811 isoform X1 n=1 Tax=Amborella trichopoda TaxID=13333 RepID=UPI0009C1595B|nr:uncharacterized protein LOC110007811 isoform X1 [Amborella trichopoda]|eukprot:XP_020526817.1 uncharacterized protein LOC110007811 isoform X1 [Amborella trichopoda]
MEEKGYVGFLNWDAEKPCVSIASPRSHARRPSNSWRYAEPRDSKWTGGGQHQWHQKQRQGHHLGRHVYPQPRTCEGSGMQAIFLSSSDNPRPSCGTGFFLPRRAGSPFHLNLKPSYSTVLLPSRVVHALNLNAHALASSLQLTPRGQSLSALPTAKDVGKLHEASSHEISELDDEDYKKDATSDCHLLTSPETLLPKEWTY